MADKTCPQRTKNVVECKPYHNVVVTLCASWESSNTIYERFIKTLLQSCKNVLYY